MNMNETWVNILEKIGVLKVPDSGAFNIRLNGKSIKKSDSSNVTITFLPEGRGMDIHINPGTKDETIYIPVVIDKAGLNDVVYNNFYIGEGSDVTIIAGCGIHNSGDEDARHDGVHAFFIGENAKIKYIEKHYGEGDGLGGRILNPVTKVTMESGSYMEMDTVQIAGVDSTVRLSEAVLNGNSTLIVREKLMTHGEQTASTEFDVDLNGEGSSAHIVSRSVAKGKSSQTFLSKINGNEKCAGHSECDAIIMDSACVKAIPEITATHVDAQLIHEAAIGKIAGEQILKLRTLGLSEAEAEAQIINGFLR